MTYISSSVLGHYILAHQFDRSSFPNVAPPLLVLVEWCQLERILVNSRLGDKGHHTYHNHIQRHDYTL